MRYLASKFDKFVVLTNSNKDEWNNKNCVVIANPLSFYPEQSSSQENPKVIVVGTHSYNKGYDLLLQAWAKISIMHPDWSLNIYGKIDNDQTFVKLSEQLGTVNSVRFFSPISQIQEAYLDASIMVLSSRTEGFGMVLIEAMACGLPCISFDCPSGPGDIIDHNHDGYLLQNGNVDAMTQKIMLLIDDTTLRKKMGLLAKQNAKRYLPENILPEWDKLFKELLQ
jgi:glycosyltransferase involved in cell wall biosynthesis